MIGSVLIVEDEFLIAQSLAMMVEDCGLTVCASTDTADDAVRLAFLHRPSLVLMDVRLKGEKDGVDAAFAIWARSPVPVIYITGSAEPKNVARINTDHPAGLLFKPFDYAALKHLMEQVLGSGQPPTHHHQ